MYIVGREEKTDSEAHQCSRELGLLFQSRLVSCVGHVIVLQQKDGDCRTGSWRWNDVKFFFFFFFARSPAIYLWGSPLLGEIFAYVTVF